MKPRSAWANGSFYLFVFVIVIAGIAVLGNVIPVYLFPLAIVAGAIFVPLIGALQLRQDDRFSEESLLKLMGMSYAQLPLIGRLLKRTESQPPKHER